MKHVTALGLGPGRVEPGRSDIESDQTVDGRRMGRVDIAPWVVNLACVISF